MPRRESSIVADRYTIRAVERALSLLRVFLTSETELSATQISKQSQLNLSTTYRLLVTLQAGGFIEQNPVTERYRLGVTCLELGSRFLKYNDIRERALGALHALRDEFGETIHLTVLDGNEVVYLEKLPGLRAIGVMSSNVGGRAPAHCTGVGKALLAYVPEEQLQQLYPDGHLRGYTESTITDLAVLRAELAEVRKKGYAVDHQEHELGVECVAVPVFKHNGVAAAMSVSGPVERMEQHIRNGRLIEEVQQAAEEVSAQMGGRWAARQPGTPKTATSASQSVDGKQNLTEQAN